MIRVNSADLLNCIHIEHDLSFNLVNLFFSLETATELVVLLLFTGGETQTQKTRSSYRGLYRMSYCPHFQQEIK